MTNLVFLFVAMKLMNSDFNCTEYFLNNTKFTEANPIADISFQNIGLRNTELMVYALNITAAAVFKNDMVFYGLSLIEFCVMVGNINKVRKYKETVRVPVFYYTF